MSPHVFLRPFLIVTIPFAAAALSAAPPERPDGDDVALPEMEPKWRVVARWYGNFNSDVEHFAQNEAGHWAMGPHHNRVSSGNVVLREEVDDVLGLNRTIVESFSWNSSVSNMYYFWHRTGKRTPAGPGGSGGGTHGESELSSPGKVTPETLKEAREQFAEAKEKYQKAAREKRDAERAVAAAEANANNNDNAANAPPPAPPKPTTQVAADMLEAQQKMAAVLADPKSTQQSRDAAMKQAQDTSQAYTDWMTRKTEEFEKKYTAEMDRLQKVMEDANSTDAQREEAGNRLVVMSEEMAKAQQEILGMEGAPVAEQPKDPRERLEEATVELEAMTRELLRAAGWLWGYENHRSQRIEARAEAVERDDGKLLVRANIDIPPHENELGMFTVAGLTPEGKPAKEPRPFGVDPAMGGDAIADEHGAATIRVTEKVGHGGEDGLIGGATGKRSYTLSRVPVKQQLKFKGRIYHRIRVPTTGPSQPNLILRGGNPIELAGAIAVQGTVRVEGRIYDPGQAPGPTTQPAAPLPPPLNTTDAADGEFELAMPLKLGKIVRLTFVYHNRDAQVTERVHVDVPVDVATHAWGKIPGKVGQAPTPPLDRFAECAVRWETRPKLFLLGTESRGAAVERENDWHIVRFEGFNSILVNTFILKAPHLNQNRHTMEITARVPARRLLAARPAFISEAKVRARLGVPATGEAPEWTEAKVAVKGFAACFPSSVTMTLAGMGEINIPPGTERTDEIQNLAQGVYQRYSDKYAKPDVGTGMPEIFPFPTTPAMVDALDTAAAVAATQPAGDAAAAAVLAMQEQMRPVLRAQYASDWPFVDGNDVTMRWLISVKKQLKVYAHTEKLLESEEENMRPWQWAWIVGRFVEHRYGTGVGVEWYTETADENQPKGHPEWRDVFTADTDKVKKVIHALGSGCGSVGSISHLSESGVGGHLLALQGVVIDVNGDIERWIFHDPYGDQSRNPTIEGYYHLKRPVASDRSKFDRDPQVLGNTPGGEHWGAYVPYGPDVDSFNGTIATKFWLLFAPKPEMTAETMKKRMLPSEVPPPPTQPSP